MTIQIHDRLCDGVHTWELPGSFQGLRVAIPRPVTREERALWLAEVAKRTKVPLAPRRKIS